VKDTDSPAIARNRRDRASAIRSLEDSDIKRSRSGASAIDPASRQSAVQFERAAPPDRSVMGREPGSSGPPPGIA
jgi:hypothetical protein